MKELKGFTLSEVLIVLAISGIVILAAFEVMFLLEKHMKTLRGNINYKEEVEVVEYVLLNDLNTHKSYYSYKEKAIYLYSLKDTLVYRFKGTVFTRKKDTLSNNVKSYCFFFAGNKIKEGCFDALFLEFYGKRKDVNVFVSAPNDAAVYYKNNR